jgi:hypothetical protein
MFPFSGKNSEDMPDCMEYIYRPAYIISMQKVCQMLKYIHGLILIEAVLKAPKDKI